MRYPPRYDEQGSTGKAVSLLRESASGPGIVLDLGCGSGAVAEPLRELGLDYVGCDVDAEALAHLSDRGFETHELSLSLSEDELTGRLRAVADGRRIAAVLLLDVLEHLVDPAAVLRAVRALFERPDRAAPVVISIPNVTHFDVAAKLLLGRWDVDSGGLLDDTHLRFFSEGELGRLLAAGGWEVEAAADTLAEISDQCWPVDAPTLRPGAPLRELLRRIRVDAGPGATTYQFVRRLRPAASGPEATPHFTAADELRSLVTVVVVGASDDAAPLLVDLEGQEPPVASIVQVGDPVGLDAVLDGIETRLVAVLDARSRVAPSWMSAIVEGLAAAPGRVLQVPVALVADERWENLSPADDWLSVVGNENGADIEGFDLLHVAPPRPVVTGAFVVPTELAAAGVRPDPDLGASGLAAWLALATQLSGSVPIGTELLLAVPQGLATASITNMALVIEALDRRPAVLPVGSVRRLVTTRDRAVRAEAELAALQQRQAVEQVKVDHLDFHLRRFGAELDDLRPELQRLRLEHARRPSRRLAALVRRLLG